MVQSILQNVWAEIRHWFIPVLYLSKFWSFIHCHIATAFLYGYLIVFQLRICAPKRKEKLVFEGFKKEIKSFILIYYYRTREQILSGLFHSFISGSSTVLLAAIKQQPLPCTAIWFSFSTGFAHLKENWRRNNFKKSQVLV